MKDLPKALRYAPAVFYVIAIIAWVFAIWTGWPFITTTQEFPELDPDRSIQVLRIIRSEPFVRGLIDAAYMAANGAIVQVLIAIYDKMKGGDE